MRRHRWFLPETPDVLGMLREQTAITIEGMEALVAWSNGEPGAANRLRECEHRADDRKRELRAALTVAFTTPLEPEDIFELSTELDLTLNSAKNTVREAEVMETAPDEAISQMAVELAHRCPRSGRCAGAACGRRTCRGDRSRRPGGESPDSNREDLPAVDVGARRGGRPP